MYSFGSGCVISVGYCVHGVFVVEVCWCGFSIVGLCGCAGIGIPGMGVSVFVCRFVWCVGGVLSFFCCVFIFLMFLY